MNLLSGRQNPLFFVVGEPPLANESPAEDDLTLDTFEEAGGELVQGLSTVPIPYLSSPPTIETPFAHAFTTNFLPPPPPTYQPSSPSVLSRLANLPTQQLIWLAVVVLLSGMSVSGWLIGSSQVVATIYDFSVHPSSSVRQQIPIRQAIELETAPQLVAAPIPTPAQIVKVVSTRGLEGSPSISVAKIEEVLRQYNSPAVGTGQAMYDLGIKYGIDPAYALAFFIHESTAGTKGLAVTTKSIGNIRQTADSGFEAYQGFRKYPTWQAGMEDWYKLIRNLYIDGWNLRTVAAIIPKYAPAFENDVAVYVNTVNNLVEGWRKG